MTDWRIILSLFALFDIANLEFNYPKIFKITNSLMQTSYNIVSYFTFDVHINQNALFRGLFSNLHRGDIDARFAQNGTDDAHATSSVRIFKHQRG